jgi:DNA-binding GntR family transcriptional regulator
VGDFIAIIETGISPLREALSRLTTVGLVTAEGPRGFRVAQVSSDDVMDLMKTMVWVESTALRASIAHGDRNWEAEIVASAHRLGINDRGQSDARFFDEKWEENHRLFHQSLVAACRAPRLLSYRALLYENVDRYRRLSAFYELGTRDVDGEHRALVDAVLRRDASEAAHLAQHTFSKPPAIFCVTIPKRPIASTNKWTNSPQRSYPASCGLSRRHESNVCHRRGLLCLSG